MDYARAIRVARARSDKHQLDVADAAGLDRSYISLIERGKRVPSREALGKIALALEIPLFLLVLLASSKEDLNGYSGTEIRELSRSLLYWFVGET